MPAHSLQCGVYDAPFRPYVEGEPAVKYRGIFLNDEAPALSGWAKEKFGTLNHQFYEKVFELILRPSRSGSGTARVLGITPRTRTFSATSGPKASVATRITRASPHSPCAEMEICRWPAPPWKPTWRCSRKSWPTSVRLSPNR